MARRKDLSGRRMSGRVELEKTMGVGQTGGFPARRKVSYGKKVSLCGCRHSPRR
jgi:hypothetical protein